MRRTSLVGGLALLCASCSLLVGTSGLSDGAPDASPTSDAGQADATLDGGAADAPGPAPDPCAGSAVVLCEKFDTADSIDAYGKITDPTTSVTTDDLLFFSAPRSAKFIILPSTDTSPDATLTLRPAGTLSDFAVEGRVHIELSEPGQAARLLHVARILDGGSEPLLLEQSGAVRSGGATTNVGVIAPGSWHAIRFEVRSSVQPPSATVTIDGASLPINLGGGWAPASVFVRLGVSEASSPTKGWIVRWDDIVVKKL